MEDADEEDLLTISEDQQMGSDWTCSNSFWTREENKAFENALAIYSGDSNPWDKIAAAVPGRTLEEIKHHFEVLVEDVDAIDSDHVPLPLYAESFNEAGKHAGPASVSRERDQSGKKGIKFSDRERFSQSNGARKRGTPWTKDEHRLFLQGMEKYGRGDWRSISRHLLLSRTPTQIASHAQKFFKRSNVIDKKRLSIHDATFPDDGNLLTQQMPDTENISGASGGSILDTGTYTTLDNLGVHLCTSPILSDCDVSACRGQSIEQVIADIDFGVSDPITSLPGISMRQWPSAKEMTRAADVGAATTASQHGKFTYQGPRTESMIDAAGVDLIADSFSCQHGVSNSQGASIEQMNGAPDFGLCAPLVTSQQKISTPLRSSIEQMIGESDFILFADPIASLPGISTSQGPSTEEMIGAADVGLSVTPTASQHGKLTYQGPLTEPMIDAAGVGFIADSMASRDGISTPQGASAEQMTGALDFGLCAPLITIDQNVSTPQGPSIEQMIGDSDFGLFTDQIASLPHISTPQVPSSRRMIGAADVGGFIAASNASQHGTLTYQGPFTELTIDAAGVGFIADSVASQDGISTPQGASTEQMTAAPDVGVFAPLITSQQKTSSPQGPITEQTNATTAFDLDDPLDTTRYDTATPQGPITGLMTGTAGGSYIVGKSQLPCGSDFNFYDPWTAGEQILAPFTSEAAREEVFPPPISMLDDLGSPFYGSFDPFTPMDMDSLTFPTFPSDEN